MSETGDARPLVALGFDDGSFLPICESEDPELVRRVAEDSVATYELRVAEHAGTLRGAVLRAQLGRLKDILAAMGIELDEVSEKVRV